MAEVVESRSRSSTNKSCEDSLDSRFEALELELNRSSLIFRWSLGTFSKVELTFSKVVLIPVGLLNVEFRVDPRLKVEFRGVDTLSKVPLSRLLCSSQLLKVRLVRLVAPLSLFLSKVEFTLFSSAPTSLISS